MLDICAFLYVTKYSIHKQLKHITCEHFIFIPIITLYGKYLLIAIQSYEHYVAEWHIINYHNTHRDK